MPLTVIQWLRPQAPNAGGLGFVPDQETRSNILQLVVYMLQLKTLRAATEIEDLMCCS